MNINLVCIACDAVSLQPIRDQMLLTDGVPLDLHLENKYFKCCLLVSRRETTEPEFRLLASLRPYFPFIVIKSVYLGFTEM